MSGSTIPRTIPLAAALASALLTTACPQPSGGSATETSSESTTGGTTGSSTGGASTGDASTGSSTGDGSTGEEATTTGSTGGDETTGDPAPACEALPGAPPPLDHEGVALVPIDIKSVEAELRFNAITRQHRGAATVDFESGPIEGAPLFDLRQQITRAVLDGEELPLSQVALVAPPAMDATMLAVGRVLEPCTAHRLELEYTLTNPVENDIALAHGPGWVAWFAELYDYPARVFAEKWLPSNLIHDTHALRVDVVVEAEVPHDVYANAAVEVIEPGRWRVAYSDATSMTPMIHLCPVDAIITSSSQVELEGALVDAEIWHCGVFEGKVPKLDDAGAELVSALKFAAGELGPYPHGDRFAAVILPLGQLASMEYEGGTVTRLASLRHEVFHNWIARGVRPLTQRDAWFDETWTKFAVNQDYMATTIALDEEPVRLIGENLWVRTFPLFGHETGTRIFATLSAAVGGEEFRAILREIYSERAGEAITTETLERDLHCRIAGDLVRPLFHRYVYGEDGEAPPPPAGYCE
ncbi:MAG: hypothetical protein H6710_01760 [Myxococcales bacterium]|nr:hypothetical protein [Myxococcales bacterium]